MTKTKIIAALTAVFACILPAKSAAPVKIEYEASLNVNASTGNFAPYMLASWNYGRFNGANGIWHDGMLKKEMTLDKRFNWGAGVEYLLGYGSAAEYSRYDAANDKWGFSSVRQAPVRLHQLYAEVKFRGVYLLAGMKERRSGIVDNRLSSGDLTRSNNACPIPGVAVGFVDFQNIPFTDGWVQIDGEIMYGRFMDKDYRTKTFSHYNGHISLDNWYTYKRCYFRTKPSMPFSVTVGMQTAGVFAGYTKWYSKGKVVREAYRGFHFRDIFDMFFPIEGNGDSYYKGNSLGSWDFKARYDFSNGSRLSAYFEWPWEDGSGIGKATGWDGLWGLQYDFGKKGIVSKAVIEYFDFTNQSGPIHVDPSDLHGKYFPIHTDGSDDNYNNSYYNSYANYGMSLGTPFIKSPIYNLDGYQGFTDNRVRGFHIGICGTVSPRLGYRILGGYRRSWGTHAVPRTETAGDTSMMFEGTYRTPVSQGNLNIRAQIAFDRGKLYGNTAGALVTISYSTSFNIGHK